MCDCQYLVLTLLSPSTEPKPLISFMVTLWGLYENIDSFSSHLKTPLKNSRLKFQGVFVFFSVQSLLFSQHFGVLALQLPLLLHPNAQ